MRSRFELSSHSTRCYAPLHEMMRGREVERWNHFPVVEYAWHISDKHQVVSRERASKRGRCIIAIHIEPCAIRIIGVTSQWRNHRHKSTRREMRHNRRVDINSAAHATHFRIGDPGVEQSAVFAGDSNRAHAGRNQLCHKPLVRCPREHHANDIHIVGTRHPTPAEKLWLHSQPALQSGHFIAATMHHTERIAGLNRRCKCRGESRITLRASTDFDNASH